MVASVLQAGLGGLQDSIRRMDRAAGRIAEVSQPSPQETPSVSIDRDPASDLVGALVDLKREETAAGASVAVIRTADEVLGTLLDVMA